MNHQQSVRLCKLSDEGSSSRSSGMMVSFRSDLSGVMRGPIWPKKLGALGDMVRGSANRKRPCTTLALGVMKLPSHQQLSWICWILRDSTPKFAHLRCKNGCSGQPRGVSSLGNCPRYRITPPTCGKSQHWEDLILRNCLVLGLPGEWDQPRSQRCKVGLITGNNHLGDQLQLALQPH